MTGTAEDTLRFTYDGSLPTSVAWSGPVNGNVSVTYNNDFKVTSQSVNSGNTVSYAYDNDGLLTQAGQMDLFYSSENGRLTGTALGNIATEYTFNPYGELSSYSAKFNNDDVFTTQYSLDNIGRIIQITENVLGEAAAYQYTYDISGRLVHVYKNGALISTYTYDSNGNRLSHTSPTGTDTGVYDDQDRMLSYGNATFGYNARGSLTFKVDNGDTTFYNYDMMGNLLSVTLPDGDFIEYLIDAQNRRIGKKRNGVLQRQWIYQDILNPVAELDGNGNLISRFVYGDKGHVPAYMIRGGVTYRYVTDHLGSVRLLVNTSTGEIVQQLSYNEFGEVLSNTSPDFQPFGYAGGLYDTQIELVRFGARDYDANVGRWTSKDPIGFGGGSVNLFEYCYSSPINAVDPSGLKLWYADPCSQAALEQFIIEIMGSARGRELLQLLHAREEIYYLHKGPHPYYYSKGKEEYRSVKQGNHVWIDPDYLAPIMTTSGQVEDSSPARQLAHELGHLARNDSERSEENETNNIQEWEDPVMTPLDGLDRDPAWYGRVASPLIFK